MRNRTYWWPQGSILAGESGERLMQSREQARTAVPQLAGNPSQHALVQHLTRQIAGHMDDEPTTRTRRTTLDAVRAS